MHLLMIGVHRWWGQVLDSTDDKTKVDLVAVMEASSYENYINHDLLNKAGAKSFLRVFCWLSQNLGVTCLHLRIVCGCLWYLPCNQMLALDKYYGYFQEIQFKDCMKE